MHLNIIDLKRKVFKMFLALRVNQDSMEPVSQVKNVTKRKELMLEYVLKDLAFVAYVRILFVMFQSGMLLC